jgi:Zn-dependent protease/predicted transcriptional regulator
MPGRSFRIAQVAGIPVGVHPLWLVIVALITWSLGAGYYPAQVHGIAPGAAYALGLASALLLFVSILAHELGHALVARRHGVEIEEIDLWLLGGVARMRGEPQRAGDELRFALAGPAVTAVIAAAFGALALGLPAGAPRTLDALVEYQALINAMILGFNLLPAFPLDGGRVARALLWRRTGDLRRATDIAAALGRAFGYVFIALGVLSALSGAAGGLWFAIIGLFVIAAARSEVMHAEIESTFTGVSAAALMSKPVATVPGDITVAEAVRTSFEPRRYTAFPVVDQRRHVLGLLTLDRVAAMTAPERAVRLVRDVADRDPQLYVRQSDDAVELIERPAFLRVGRAVVCDSGGTPVGLVSITDVQRAIRAARLAGKSSRADQDAP